MSHGSQVARANLLHSKVGEVLGVGEGDLAGELVASAQGRDVCVVGLGLIGGSLLRAAVHAGRSAWGAAASAEAAAAARASGHSASTDLGNALRRAVETDALVVLATPLAAPEDVLAEVAHSAPTCRLTDVVSVKKQVARLVAQCSPASRYVGSHPVVAAAASGCNAGSLQLFNGVVWVVETDDEIDLSVWAGCGGPRLFVRCGGPPGHGGGARRCCRSCIAAALSTCIRRSLAALLTGLPSGGRPIALAGCRRSPPGWPPLRRVPVNTVLPEDIYGHKIIPLSVLPVSWLDPYLHDTPSPSWPWRSDQPGSTISPAPASRNATVPRRP
jgi:hypothetical protein